VTYSIRAPVKYKIGESSILIPISLFLPSFLDFLSIYAIVVWLPSTCYIIETLSA
jgi:hypothetical protein